ncbi:MAG TPA: hydrolase 2, exosortase A system-associated [Gammaproteobacteria bacterium]|nr:hydrolase 2, exosortase A system-associated [Gammaproteobacteria bacterium]
MTESPYRLRASFLSGSRGLLFGLWVLPQENRGSTGVLLVPPFAEEMNRSRHMLSLQARALAEAGFRTLILDLFGTGDSAGEFAEASVETWLRDLSTGLSALSDEGCTCVVIVAVRFGALLASRLAVATASTRIGGFVLWQPVQTGSAFMTQFLRLRLAADLATGGQSITVKGLQEELCQGRSVDVGGYELSPRLYADIQAMKLSGEMSSPAQPPVTLMEISAKGGVELSPVMRSLRDRWVDHGVQVTVRKIEGDPFWQTPEITLAPALFGSTVEAVRHMEGVI